LAPSACARLEHARTPGVAPLHRGANVLAALPGCGFARRRRAWILARRERRQRATPGFATMENRTPQGVRGTKRTLATGSRRLSGFKLDRYASQGGEFGQKFTSRALPKSLKRQPPVSLAAESDRHQR